MGERKVLNKYYPPDYDPSKILRRKAQPRNQQKIRMMLPMGIRCNTCGSYIREGAKFNSRKEDVAGETYLGIQLFRFYIKCSNCSSEITFKTDAKNSDYNVESGAKRMRDFKEEEDKEDDDLGDTIKDLEKRRLKSKQELDNLAADHELICLKSRQEKTSGDAYANALEVLQKEKKVNEVEEEKAFIKAYIEGRRAKEHAKKVIDDEDDGDMQHMLHVQKRSKIDGVQIGKSKTSGRGTCLGKIAVQKKKPREEDEEPNLQSLFQQYGGDDIDDD